MRCLLLFAMLFPLLMVSCSRGGKELAAKLHLADSLIEAEPDSGVALLVSLREQAEDASKANRYRYQLLLAKAMNKAYVPFTSDSAMKEVVNYYDNNGDANERMEAHYLLGCVYRDLDSLPQALLEYETAISQADTTKADCDFKTLSRVYGQAAEVSLAMQLPLDQLTYSKQGRECALKAKDTISAITLYDHMASAYELMAMPDSEIAISEKASKLYLHYGERNGAAMALGPIINDYVNKKDWINAKRCINIYEKESGVFLPNGEIAAGREMFYYQKAQYFIGLSEMDSAHYFLEKLRSKHNLTFNENIAVVKGLYDLYNKTGNKDSILKYSKQMIGLTGQSLKQQMYRGTSRISTLYKENLLVEKAHQKELKAERFQNTFYFTLGLASFAAFIFSLIYNRVSSRIREERLKKEHIQELFMQANAGLMQARKDLSILERQNEKEKEQFIKEKQIQIDKLQAKIQDLLDSRHIADMKRKLYDAAITNKFRDMANKGEIPTNRDWKELNELMHEKFPVFYERLNRNKVLRVDEYNMCILIRLGFRPSDIGKLMGISISNVSEKRSRMLKKITGKDGSTYDFDKFLFSIH